MLCVVVVSAFVTMYSSTQVAVQSPEIVQDSCTTTLFVPLDAGAEKTSRDSALVIVRFGASKPHDVGVGEGIILPF